MLAHIAYWILMLHYPHHFILGKKGGQHGILSCIAISPDDPDIYAVGSYSKQLVIYDEKDTNPIATFEGHKGGVTHLTFSHNGMELYSGGRKVMPPLFYMFDGQFLCYSLY